jgi:2-polyprenyl-3-methyl-5-hydroxy-6-metoxy-1,4-benzoquinol methylase
MASVADHYERHLGEIYAWMQGGPEAGFERARAELQVLGVERAESRLAVDLGAGFGSHAVPLADLGWTVIAVERCGPLLHELAQHAVGRTITVIDSDISTFGRHLSRPVDLILCLGDTLTHLPDPSTVSGLLSAIATSLAPGGRFVTTFRDYTRALNGDARFIAVRSEAAQILTCFLEYGEQTLEVHDLIHRLTDGVWRLSVSSYPKLRLDPTWVTRQLEECGLVVNSGTAANGMVRIAARRDSA